MIIYRETIWAFSLIYDACLLICLLFIFFFFLCGAMPDAFPWRHWWLLLLWLFLAILMMMPRLFHYAANSAIHIMISSYFSLFFFILFHIFFSTVCCFIIIFQHATPSLRHVTCFLIHTELFTRCSRFILTYARPLLCFINIIHALHIIASHAASL